MVAPGPTSLAKAPPALLDCIFRRGKWARGAASAIDHQIAAPADDPRRNDGYRPRDDSIRRYAVAALDNQVRKVEQAAKGSRNQTVNDAALQLGHLVAAGALSEAVVRQLLEDAACVCGLAKDDGIASVRSTISSGLRLALGNRPISPNWVGALPGAARRGLPGGLWRLVTILPKAEVQRSSRSLREMPATMLACRLPISATPIGL